MNTALVDWAAARRALAERAAVGVVSIETGRGVRCSGIVWDSETLVTAAEVLQGADAVAIHTANTTVTAKILACDLTVDVAVLKASLEAPSISAAQPASPSSGDDVLIAGRSASSAIMAWSHVEQLGPAWRSRAGGELDRLIRLSPGLRRELEGGGVFDLEGRLCAMAVRGPRHTTLGIPAETIERVVTTVLRHGRLPQPYLGVRLQPVSLDDGLRRQLSRASSDAVIVVGIEEDSPAAAKLLFADLIVSVGGVAIENAIDLKVALTRVPIASPLSVQVLRAGARLETTVVVGERDRRELMGLATRAQFDVSAVADTPAALAGLLIEHRKAWVVTGSTLNTSLPFLEAARSARSPVVAVLNDIRGNDDRPNLRYGGLAVLHGMRDGQTFRAAAAASRRGLNVWDPSGDRPGQTAIASRSPLSPRERAVLELTAAGLSNKTIGRRLGISPNTVKFHLQAAFAKLGVASRAEAVMAAIRCGELSI